jgi:hypothetical protein
LCDPKSDKANSLLALLPQIPRDRLIIGTDAPRWTPQNIDDPYIREMKNEPSNLPWVLKYFAEAWKVSVEELGETVRQNTKKFYRMRDKDDAPLEGEIIGALNSQKFLVSPFRFLRQKHGSDSPSCVAIPFEKQMEVMMKVMMTMMKMKLRQPMAHHQPRLRR